MKDRSLKELYIILFNHIKDKTYILGLCVEIRNLEKKFIITHDEYEILIEHFKSQKYLHPEFMTKERNWEGGYLWWSGEEDDNPDTRKAFIQKIISTL